MHRKPPLRKSVLSLYAVQMTTYVVPLITLPWLTRVLGPDAFGQFTFCTAAVAYLTLFTDYGFNLSATQKVAVYSHEREARSQIFWSTIATKALLSLLCFLVLLALTYTFDKLAAERPLLIVAYLAVIGSVLTPIWYFQGTERQATLSAILIGVRTAAIPAIFAFVTAPDDVINALAINGSTQVIGGIACLSLLAKERDLDGLRTSRLEVLESLKDGWHLFLSTAAISLYTNLNVVLLGFVAGNTAVGYYGAAEKLTQAVRGLLSPINQAVFPRLSRLMIEARTDGLALVRRLLRWQGGLAFALSVTLFAAAPYVVPLLYGAQYEQAVDVLRWLAGLPFVIGLSNVFGIHAMIPLGMKKAVSWIVLAAGAVNLILLYVLAGRFGATGAAAAVLATETLVMLAMAGVLHSLRVPIFSAQASRAEP